MLLKIGLGWSKIIYDLYQMERITLKDKQFTPYLPEGAIRSRVLELAYEISTQLGSPDLLAIPILQGSFLFAADLLREFSFYPDIHFIRVASYGKGMESSGKLEWQLDLPPSLEDRDILLIEDIVDSGFTIDNVRQECMNRGARSVTVVALLFKPAAFTGKTSPEYVGFSIPNDFVVGYGLDYAHIGRNLKGIYQVVPD